MFRVHFKHIPCKCLVWGQSFISTRTPRQQVLAVYVLCVAWRSENHQWSPLGMPARAQEFAEACTHAPDVLGGWRPLTGPFHALSGGRTAREGRREMDKSVTAGEVSGRRCVNKFNTVKVLILPWWLGPEMEKGGGGGGCSPNTSPAWCKRWLDWWWWASVMKWITASVINK